MQYTKKIWKIGKNTKVVTVPYKAPFSVGDKVLVTIEKVEQETTPEKVSDA